uniref:Uncharacterized protein n=1 Tax=Oryza punctata TaxID=4537 RepID=A0A0E0K4M6_ORYPU
MAHAGTDTRGEPEVGKRAKPRTRAAVPVRCRCRARGGGSSRSSQRRKGGFSGAETSGWLGRGVRPKSQMGVTSRAQAERA